MACSPSAAALAVLAVRRANTLTSVSTIMDLVTGLTRKPSSCSRSASSRTSSRPKAVTSTMAGGCFKRLVALDVAARLQAVHAGHPPVHEDDVVRVGRRRAAGSAAMASLPDATASTRLATALKRLLQDLARGGVVVHDQHAKLRQLFGNDLASARRPSRRRARR